MRAAGGSITPSCSRPKKLTLGDATAPAATAGWLATAADGGAANGGDTAILSAAGATAWRASSRQSRSSTEHH